MKGMRRQCNAATNRRSITATRAECRWTSTSGRSRGCPRAPRPPRPPPPWTARPPTAGAPRAGSAGSSLTTATTTRTTRMMIRIPIRSLGSACRSDRVRNAILCLTPLSLDPSPPCPYPPIQPTPHPRPTPTPLSPIPGPALFLSRVCMTHLTRRVLLCVADHMTHVCFGLRSRPYFVRLDHSLTPSSTQAPRCSCVYVHAMCLCLPFERLREASASVCVALAAVVYDRGWNCSNNSASDQHRPSLCAACCCSCFVLPLCAAQPSAAAHIKKQNPRALKVTRPHRAPRQPMYNAA